MNKIKLNELSIENKLRILKAIANGIIKKSDLNKQEIIEIITSDNGLLIYDNFCDRGEYRHNGTPVSKDEFNRLEAIYNAIFPDRVNVIYITMKEGEWP